MSDSRKPVIDLRQIEMTERLNAFRLPFLERKTFFDVWYANIMQSVGDHVRQNAPLGEPREGYLDRWLRHTQPGWFAVQPSEGAREEWFFAHPFNARLRPEADNYNAETPDVVGGKWGSVRRLESGQWQWETRMGPLSSVRHLGTGGVEPSRDCATARVREVLAESIARLILNYDT